MNILVTGGNGFVGQAVCQSLTDAGHTVRATVSDPSRLSQLPIQLRSRCSWLAMGDQGSQLRAIEALAGIDVVVHLAARVHVMHETAANPLAEFKKVNALWTADLAESAAKEGVRRFIFMSSIGVNGDRSPKGRPFTELDKPSPHGSYAISKHLAEQELKKVANNTHLELAIIRPPLAYGPGVKGSFLSLMRWIHRGIPLPLANLTNQRSLISSTNLANFILQCIHHPNAANQTFLVSDREDLSTPDLIRKLASNLSCPARLLPFPISLLMLAAKLMGISQSMQRLTGTLQVDSSQAQLLLGWNPPQPVEEGFKETARWFKSL